MIQIILTITALLIFGYLYVQHISNSTRDKFDEMEPIRVEEDDDDL